MEQIVFPDEAILIRTTLTNDCAGAKIDATMTVNDVTMIVGRARWKGLFGRSNKFLSFEVVNHSERFGERIDFSIFRYII